MSPVVSTAPRDPAAYLRAHDRKSLLRFITCGSVDDGKSTLIGRLLYESKLIYDDQLAALEQDSRRVGTRGAELDFALLVDGLSAEREQGITIDVAYRYFATEKRKFIVADTPGHEQYTRNMVTGASTADLAVILVDARKGVLTQTRRHSYLARLLGISRVVLAVNKMDLVGHARAVYEAIAADYRAFGARIGLEQVTAIPISAVYGDNVTEHGTRMPWYQGETLLEHLENVAVDTPPGGAAFRLPVQWVNRPNADFRGFCGQVVSGTVRPGDRIRVLPSGRESRVARIVTADGDLEAAVAGQSVTLTLGSEVDVGRGDVIAAADSAPQGPISSRRPSCGCTMSRCCRGVPICSSRRRAPFPPPSCRSSTRSMSIRSSTPRPSGSSSTTSAYARSSSTSRSPSSPTRRIARSAVSSSSTASPTAPSAQVSSTSRCAARRTCTGRRWT